METMNIKSFIKLVKLYKSITIEQLIKMQKKLKELNEYSVPHDILTEITGFNQTANCSLCKEVKYNCELCIWSIKPNKRIYYCINTSFSKILNSQTIKGLYTNLQKRIIIMESLIEKYETK